MFSPGTRNQEPRTRSKKQPIRTCLGCYKAKDKNELVRIVRTKEGKVEIDPTGKKPGRGTYLCFENGCIKKAFKNNQVVRALKTKISKKELDNLYVKVKELNKNDKKSL